ncbi:MAG TPA: LEA type 2 family protein [Longimicrobiales bacterium]
MANARIARFAALVVALASLNACSSAIKEPEVKLDNISVGSIGFDGGTLRVRLNVINPNSFGLQAQGLDYLVEIAEEGDGDARWDTLTSGRYDERITVEADDSAFVEIPIRFRYRDLGSAIGSLLATGSFDYRISGRVQLREPMRRELPFRRTGNTDELRD